MDRNAQELAPELVKIAGDESAKIDRRLASLWALEGLQKAEQHLVAKMSIDRDRNIRREAIRVARLFTPQISAPRRPPVRSPTQPLQRR